MIEGPIVTVIAGYLAYLGYVNPVLIYLVVVAGDITGDFAWYAAGRWSRRGIGGGWAARFGVTPQRLSRVERHFEKHSGKTLLVGKLTQGIGVLVLAGAGAARMRPGRFVAINLAATLPKSLGLLLFGYYFGRLLTQANSVLDYVAVASVGVVVLAVMAYAVPRRFAGRFQ